MAKHRAVKTPGWWLIQVFFKNPEDSRQFSDEVKRLPFDDRRWCRKIGAWAVRNKHTDFVIDIANRYLGIKVKA
jgi:hypothetical protein